MYQEPGTGFKAACAGGGLDASGYRSPWAFPEPPEGRPRPSEGGPGAGTAPGSCFGPRLPTEPQSQATGTIPIDLPDDASDGGGISSRAGPEPRTTDPNSHTPRRGGTIRCPPRPPSANEKNAAPPAMDMWITRKSEFPTSPRHNNNDSLSHQNSMVDPYFGAENIPGGDQLRPHFVGLINRLWRFLST